MASSQLSIYKTKNRASKISKSLGAQSRIELETLEYEPSVIPFHYRASCYL